ncbi:M-phase phosphoprotein 6 [Macleaya cordata]|uniref:M-phase phosphoprotein 6 n=1 Tax=Macleaya cordata TaxID=56857 RepID=A0A200R562_MACCD|nr:M-phase phosphoprotein 6 [Macleaya cordata]
MAKRELSSTLKNLKFMQRAAQKEEPPKKEEEVKDDGNFASPDTQKRKCVVIMEGNPHPGALKGRMSFQSFNPSIDKLNEEAANPGQSQVPATNSDRKMSDR